MCLITIIAPMGIGETTMAEYIIEELYKERNHKEYMTGLIRGELIRCKDCKYYVEELCWNVYGRCVTVSDMDYCSSGERKEETEC